MEKILLIDGHNCMWRANVRFGPPVTHAICESCSNPKHSTELHCTCGSPWHVDGFCYGDKYLVVYNFFKNLRPIIELFSPNKCFFVLEGHPQFRYDIFSDYKANRIIKTGSAFKAKENFSEAKRIIIPLLSYLPITIARAQDYECDDVIATLCENMKTEDLTVLSNDSDYIQLLQKQYSNIKIYNPIAKKNLEAPSYPYIAWKCLNGDKSDNIPSLMSPKKALDTINNPTLFDKFMSVEENRANFSRNRDLIEFRQVNEEDIQLVEGRARFDELKQKFTEMRFDSMLNDKSWSKYVHTFDCITC